LGSGGTDLHLCALIAISLAAAGTDLMKGRIYNWLTLPAIVLGIAASAALGGWTGARDSLFGAALGLVLYGWLFFARAMGGGDVKLLMALGAWGGPRYAFDVAVLAIFLGAALGLLMLAARGRLLDFGRRIYRFALTILVREMEIEAPRIDRKQTMPYGIPMAAAAVWVAWADPLTRWGWRPW
jgi:prepilin peptidase CpaA